MAFKVQMERSGNSLTITGLPLMSPIISYEEFKQKCNFTKWLSSEQVSTIDTYVSKHLQQADWAQIDKLMRRFLRLLGKWRNYLPSLIYLICQEKISRYLFGLPSAHRKSELRKKLGAQDRFFDRVEEVRGGIQARNAEFLRIGQMEKTTLVSLLDKITRGHRKAESQAKLHKKAKLELKAKDKIGTVVEYKFDSHPVLDRGKLILNPTTRLLVFVFTICQDKVGSKQKELLNDLAKFLRLWQFIKIRKYDETATDLDERLRQRFKSYSDRIELIPFYDTDLRLPNVVVVQWKARPRKKSF